MNALVLHFVFYSRVFIKHAILLEYKLHEGKDCFLFFQPISKTTSVFPSTDYVLDL